MDYEATDFNEDVIKKSFEIPVLVDFWAEWCGPCKMLSPVLERLAEKFKSEWKLVKVNTDNNNEIASRFGIRGIPNVKLFIKGKVTDEFTGVLPENKILDWLKKAVPGKNQEKIENAVYLFSIGNNIEAEKILRGVIASDKSNEEAKVLLAKSIFFKNPGESIGIISGIDELSKFHDSVDSLRTFYRLFEVSNDSLPDNIVKSKYLKAIDLIKSQDFDQALADFIEVIKTDRYYDDDGARKACLAIFKYLGEEHEITQKHRRDFGSALYI